MASLAELDGIFAEKDEQRATPKAFLGGKKVFALLVILFSNTLVEHCGTLRPAAVTVTAVGSLELTPTCLVV